MTNLDNDLLLDPYHRSDRACWILTNCGINTITEWNGHFYRGKRGPQEEFLLDNLEFKIRASPEDLLLMEENLVTLDGAIKGGAPLGKSITLSPRFDQCYVCGKSYSLEFNGTSFSLGGDPCEHPDGIVSEFEINVPSGKLVIENDLRDWFKAHKKGSVNYTIGRHKLTLAYSSIGLAHGFVGNSCPAVYKDSEGVFRIGSWYKEVAEEDDEVDEEVEGVEDEECPWGEKVAWICTDLWWYSICDLEELQRRESYYSSEETRKRTVIDVRPGVYRFRHNNDVDDEGLLILFATFEWVREPDPVIDTLQSEMSQNNSALECCIQEALGLRSPAKEPKTRWENLTSDQRISLIQYAADQLMCVIGSGVEWHENGFPRMEISEEARLHASQLSEDGLVPLFEEPCGWYPISRGFGNICIGSGVSGSFGDREKITLNPSFVHLGLNIARNMILHPPKPELNRESWPPFFDTHSVRERMRIALECYKGLRTLYPEVSAPDQEFEERVASGSLELEIESRDLGPLHPPESRWPPRPKAYSFKAGFFEFDTSKLTSQGHFCGHPVTSGFWSRREDAQRFSISFNSGENTDPGSLMHELGGIYWGRSARNSIPLKTFGRIVGPTPGEPQLEVSFDYGSEEMVTRRWAIPENCLSALVEIDEETYWREVGIASQKFLEDEITTHQVWAERMKGYPNLNPSDFKPSLHTSPEFDSHLGKAKPNEL